MLIAGAGNAGRGQLPYGLLVILTAAGSLLCLPGRDLRPSSARMLAGTPLTPARRAGPGRPGRPPPHATPPRAGRLAAPPAAATAPGAVSSAEMAEMAELRRFPGPAPVPGAPATHTHRGSVLFCRSLHVLLREFISMMT